MIVDNISRWLISLSRLALLLSLLCSSFLLNTVWEFISGMYQWHTWKGSREWVNLPPSCCVNRDAPDRPSMTDSQWGRDLIWSLGIFHQADYPFTIEKNLLSSEEK